VSRPLLDGTEPVTQLYQAVIASAERARHTAWETSSQPAWSPHLTADSLRQAAATTTVTSHHCQLLLRTLAARTPRRLRAQRPAVPGRRRRRTCPRQLAAPGPGPQPGRHRHHAAPGPDHRRARRPRLVHRPPRLRRPGLDPVQRTRPPHELAPQPADFPMAPRPRTTPATPWPAWPGPNASGYEPRPAPIGSWSPPDPCPTPSTSHIPSRPPCPITYTRSYRCARPPPKPPRRRVRPL
jgi:hypothetical protein